MGTGRRAAASTASADSAAQLSHAFSVQAAGEYSNALRQYRQLLRAHSPVIKTLAGNAEALLLLRAPLPLEEKCQDGDVTQVHRDFQVGDEVLAPWAEDGGEYAATVVAIDAAAGLCTVDWEDGGTTCRTVPIASLSTRSGEVCMHAQQERPQEVLAWCVRRSLRRSLLAWELQAQAGVAHDAFVDVAGLLGDTAMAELHAALSSPGGMLLPDGLGHARRHLQRARWLAERSYRPDPLALATLCVHRAELHRLSTAAAARTGLTGEASPDSFREALSLHERASLHFAAAASAWKKNDSQPSAWRRVGGDVCREALQELLWAKTLSSVAAVTPRTADSQTPAGANLKRRKSAQMPRHSGKRRLAAALRTKSPPDAAAAAGDSLPEKLLPLNPGLPREVDPLLRVQSPARAAAERAWRALEMAAGWRPPSKRHEQSHFFGATTAASDAARLAADMPQGHMLARMLLEASVIIFVMGHMEHRGAWARGVAAPLVEAARDRLASQPQGAIDDCSLVASLLADAICKSELSTGQSTLQTEVLSRRELLQKLAPVQRGNEDRRPEHGDLEEESGTAARLRTSGRRWALASYSALDEIYVMRSKQYFLHLPAPPPLTWYIEGLALAQAAPASKQTAL